MIKFLLAGLALAVLCFTTYDAQGAVFLKIDSIPGDSVVTGHENEIVISSYQFDASLPVVTGAGGAGASKASFSDLELTKTMDKSSPKFFTQLTSGKSLPKAEIFLTKNNGGKQTTFVHYTMEDVFISSYSVSSGGDTPSESVGLNFAKLQTETIPQNPDGSLGTPVSFCWDSLLNKVCSISSPPVIPDISINDVSVTEGNSSTTDAVFTVSLSEPSTQIVTVDFATAPGTATEMVDYATSSGQLVFNPGETSHTVTVAVNGDVINEADETFLVNLSNPTNGNIADNQGVGTITNDDPLPRLSINDTNVIEGDTGTVNAAFKVSLLNSTDQLTSSGQTVIVNFSTANGTGTSAAMSGTDFIANSGTLIFAPGETNKTITVQVNGDLINEPDETFFVNLSSPTNAVISDNQGVGTIVNDDPPPIANLPPPSGTGQITFATSNGGFSSLTSIPSTNLPTPPPPGSYPIGFFSWSITKFAPATHVNITITSPVPLMPQSKYFKLIGGTWVSVPVIINGNKMNITITDNGPFDGNPLPGTISDPGAITNPTNGRITGGGSIGSGIEFGFEVKSDLTKSKSIRGELEYHDKSAKLNLHSEKVTFLSVDMTISQATFSGSLDLDKNHKGYSFIAVISDPDKKGEHDKFSITVSDNTGKVIYQKSGTVKGHIEIHKFFDKDDKSDSGSHHDNDKSKH